MPVGEVVGLEPQLVLQELRQTEALGGIVRKRRFIGASRKPMTAAELDRAMQHQKAAEEGRDPNKLCLKLDGGMPCGKVEGHDGPCYAPGPSGR